MKPEQIAAKHYEANPYYAYKLILKFPAPGVTADDYHGLWYEALYETAVKEPEKALTQRLHLVMAYRYFCDNLRSRNRKFRSNPIDWANGTKTYEKVWRELIIELESQGENFSPDAWIDELDI